MIVKKNASIQPVLVGSLQSLDFSDRIFIGLQLSLSKFSHQFIEQWGKYYKIIFRIKSVWSDRWVLEGFFACRRLSFLKLVAEPEMVWFFLISFVIFFQFFVTMIILILQMVGIDVYILEILITEWLFNDFVTKNFFACIFCKWLELFPISFSIY